jgi:hypothetical protein
METYTRELTLTDTEELRLYRQVFELMRADALQGEEARNFLGRLRDQVFDAQ